MEKYKMNCSFLTNNNNKDQDMKNFYQIIQMKSLKKFMKTI